MVFPLYCTPSCLPVGRDSALKAGIAGYSPFSKPLDRIMRDAQFRRKTKSAMGVWTLANFIPASAGIRGKMNLPTSHISGIVLR